MYNAALSEDGSFVSILCFWLLFSFHDICFCLTPYHSVSPPLFFSSLSATVTLLLPQNLFLKISYRSLFSYSLGLELEVLEPLALLIGSIYELIKQNLQTDADCDFFCKMPNAFIDSMPDEIFLQHA